MRLLLERRRLFVMCGMCGMAVILLVGSVLTLRIERVLAVRETFPELVSVPLQANAGTMEELHAAAARNPFHSPASDQSPRVSDSHLAESAAPVAPAAQRSAQIRLLGTVHRLDSSSIAAVAGEGLPIRLIGVGDTMLEYKVARIGRGLMVLEHGDSVIVLTIPGVK